ncbi:hypothetical protein B9N43_16870 [Denitratisoma sp. DHT3]|uniref:hypothetical protein n=1 Tax=Denitratisoma sp. DHT3 TaxID=1981880 RepID=UPI001198BF23|nr:hypothetical protein [Denitratisoma sp. DHT3]QDX82758.1 hypothetical protein B9N43_16870 [Denitratisoma sp. DHT3]
MSQVLYIGPTGQALWRREEGRWRHGAAPAAEAAWVVTDLPEESISKIRTPRLLGRDRSALIARQLAAAYPDSPYRTFLTPAQQGGLLDRLAPTRHILYGIGARERIDSALDALAAPVAGVWPTSLLLWQLCRHKDLPADLLIALPGPDNLRIVYLRKRTPVLTRLTPTPDLHAKQIIEEIVRTLRYLENTQVVKREGKPHPLLYLGDSGDMKPLLTANNLRLVTLPGTTAASPADWRQRLFDLALRSPAGQLAPVERRIPYLAARVRRATRHWIAGALVVGAAIVAANLHTVYGLLTEKRAIDAENERAATQQRAVSGEIARYDVEPALVRRAIALHQEEIAAAPDAAYYLRLAGGLIAFDPNLRLANFSWRELEAGVPPCAATADALAAVKDARAPARKVELRFELAIPPSYRPSEHAFALRSVSRRIAAVAGITLWQDATHDAAGSSLRGGVAANGAEKFAWCVTLPSALPLPPEANNS